MTVLTGAAEMFLFAAEDVNIERPTIEFEAMPAQPIKPISVSTGGKKSFSVDMSRPRVPVKKGSDDYLLRTTPSHLLPSMDELFQLFMSSRI
jgi:hypothetical protein